MSAAFDQASHPQQPALATGLALGGDVGDYLALLKPRVMFLVVVTALVGLLVAPGPVHPVIAFASILAIAVGAGASGALNMWYDADIDQVMTRTARRPIPAGRIARSEALAFGLALSAGSVLVLGIVANWFAAAFLAFTIFFYAVVYSMWLKRSTPQTIVIGGAAGAFPPMIGEAVVTGGVGWSGFVLFLIIFLWTPPHFWALALVKTADYGRANIPMLPNVAGDRATRRQILAYTLVMAPVAVLPAFMGMGGWLYLVVSVASGLAMILLAALLLRAPDTAAAHRRAMQLFGFSILYLFALFAVLLAENALGLMLPLPARAG